MTKLYVETECENERERVSPKCCDEIRSASSPNEIALARDDENRPRILGVDGTLETTVILRRGRSDVRLELLSSRKQIGRGTNTYMSGKSVITRASSTPQ